MAKLTRDDVLKLAELAKLELTEEETSLFQKEISEILQYVEQLQSVDVTGLEPTNQVTGLSDVMRKDTEVDYRLDRKVLFENLPDSEDNQIKTKRVL
jgi:aspartyl-tRNA(Asn)/glutamyl-tRNA(Gln) amidotransferase subunit C